MEGYRKNVNPVIREACKACQDSFSGHPKLVRKLKTFYISTDLDKVFEDFIWYLRYLISGVTERSPFVDRSLEFVVKFACYFLEKDEKPKNGPETDVKLKIPGMLPLQMKRKKKSCPCRHGNENCTSLHLFNQ
eukprot:GFUD01112381.1.p1 GENE.GFUD01112381.1~~GFUD01112381.1.p1  ORF type:complete len:133 (-),score=32.59 GFUD01112381.1:186-584(-)